ncbi:mitochondrial import protein Pam17 [Clavulina sp. PMI_390]|nr:mitochondrial import protein Pam17 [Clavulina sp. PMI_390]
MSSTKILGTSARLQSATSLRARVLPSTLHRALATSSATNASANPTTSATPSNAGPLLPWSEYLAIRRGKRKWEIATTIPTTITAFTTGFSYFGSLQPEPGTLIMGIEPIWVYLAATIACAGMCGGYLVGPLIGGSIWRMTHRKKVALIDAREREFHEHIVKNRVDPSRQSATNPVPDYYGENIGSLKDYRQWLRDQSKYRKKAAWPEDEA